MQNMRFSFITPFSSILLAGRLPRQATKIRIVRSLIESHPVVSHTHIHYNLLLLFCYLFFICLFLLISLCFSLYFSFSLSALLFISFYVYFSHYLFAFLHFELSLPVPYIFLYIFLKRNLLSSKFYGAWVQLLVHLFFSLQHLRNLNHWFLVSIKTQERN